MFTYLLMLFFTVSIFSQQKGIYFSDALDLHLKQYIESCQKAVMQKDFEELEVLFDSLVATKLKGTLIDGHKLNRLDSGYIKLDSLQRPLFLNTTSSWYLKNDEEIEAINSLADEFRGKIDVVILFWDERKTVKQVSERYNESVIITYVDESTNKHNEIITNYKHALGIPACFYVSSRGEIMDINRGAFVKFSPVEDFELYVSNYKLFQTQLIKLLLKDELSRETILTTTD